jgi:hypothetical protein
MLRDTSVPPAQEIFGVSISAFLPVAAMPNPATERQAKKMYAVRFMVDVLSSD